MEINMKNALTTITKKNFIQYSTVLFSTELKI